MNYCPNCGVRLTQESHPVYLTTYAPYGNIQPPQGVVTSDPQGIYGQPGQYTK